MKKLSGSRCHSIFTFKKHDWDTMLKNYFDNKNIVTKEMRHGNEQEPFARGKFEANNPHLQVIEVGFFISAKYPWLGYSPDGVAFQEAQPKRLLEIKCPYLGKYIVHLTLLNKRPIQKS